MNSILLTMLLLALDLYVINRRLLDTQGRKGRVLEVSQISGSSGASHLAFGF